MALSYMIMMVVSWTKYLNSASVSMHGAVPYLSNGALS